MGKWYEVDPADGKTPAAGSRLWRINVQSYFAGFAYVTFGAQDMVGFRGPYWFKLTDLSELQIAPAYIPRRDGDWDAREGLDAADPAAFLCWAPDAGGPVAYYGRIRWQSLQEPVIAARDCASVVVDGLSCWRSALLIKFTNPNASGSGHVLRNCDGVDLGSLASILGGAYGSGTMSSDFLIEGNKVERAHASAINASYGISNGTLQDNTMLDCGLIRSEGGIYFGDCYAPAGAPIHVRRNTGVRQRYGRYYLWDGRVVMTDSDSANVLVYGNIAIDCHQAYGSNTGVSGCRWWGNIAYGCDHGYVESDLLGFSSPGSGRSPQDTIVANNSFLDCGIRRWYESDGRKPDSERLVRMGNDGAIVLGNRPSNSAGTTSLFNNVITISGDMAGIVSGVSIEDTVVGKFAMESNCVYGARQIAALYGTPQAINPSNFVADPQIDGWWPRATSPLKDTGIDWWSADGRLRLHGPNHIGAVMPRFA